MAYKRQIDRLPIIPAGAKVQNVTCHYCIVGCGYKAYTWPMNTQGTAASNWSGEDLTAQQPMKTDAWYAPSMYNVVKQDGQNVHLVIKPDVDCVVNSGLGSVRGARMAENRRSDVTGTQQQRLPVLVGLNPLNREAFETFAGGLATEFTGDSWEILEWANLPGRWDIQSMGREMLLASA